MSLLHSAMVWGPPTLILGDVAGPSQEIMLVPIDFPPQQCHNNTLHSAFDQVMKTDGQTVCPNVTVTFLHFVFIRDRLCRVTETPEEHNQFQVLKSWREMIFRVARYSLMAYHVGYDKTLESNHGLILLAEHLGGCAAMGSVSWTTWLKKLKKAPLRPLPIMKV